jgi:hypothetical protein
MMVAVAAMVVADGHGEGSLIVHYFRRKRRRHGASCSADDSRGWCIHCIMKPDWRGSRRPAKARENISALFEGWWVGAHTSGQRSTHRDAASRSKLQFLDESPGPRAFYSTAGGTAPRADRLELHWGNVGCPREPNLEGWLACSTTARPLGWGARGSCVAPAL